MTHKQPTDIEEILSAVIQKHGVMSRSFILSSGN